MRGSESSSHITPSATSTLHRSAHRREQRVPQHVPIRTLRERFSLGPPLTGRDAIAADIAPILSRDRAPEDWPEVTARPVPPLLDPLVAMDQPLPPLGKYLLGTAIALDTLNTGHVPAVDPKTATVQQARDYMIDRQARIWPGLVKHPG